MPESTRGLGMRRSLVRPPRPPPARRVLPGAGCAHARGRLPEQLLPGVSIFGSAEAGHSRALEALSPEGVTVITARIGGSVRCYLWVGPVSTPPRSGPT